MIIDLSQNPNISLTIFNQGTKKLTKDINKIGEYRYWVNILINNIVAGQVPLHISIIAQPKKEVQVKNNTVLKGQDYHQLFSNATKAIAIKIFKQETSNNNSTLIDYYITDFTRNRVTLQLIFTNPQQVSQSILVRH
ncbi:UNKNOWN [Stylonychia lemnae]|uniref:Uncharacterized protein n=1 Tax=Stylonychia lemnae TaxID=5949 RepID=A0A077ZR71_STYLE|nr:UNKNOWN [Stylonychia lemnae]|eukprot:CDW72413.1 UNKNOWN [Stylonychia lemnae]